MNELVAKLTQALGVQDNQARGGAGLLLKLAQSKLGGDFGKIAAVVPDAQDLIKAAPEAGGAAKLLGGLAGAQQAPAGAGTGDDLLSSLLGGLTGAAAPSGSKPVKIDTAQLLKAGMAYMQAKQSGSSDINALLSALMAGSRMGTQNYRTQSGTLVANSLLKALAQMSQ